MEERTAIRVLHSKGVGIRKIATLLGLSRNTVRKYLRDDSPPQYRCNQPRVSQWEAYRQEIEVMYFQKRFRASRIYKELKQKGAGGGRSSFYEYFNKVIREASQASHGVHERYETAPGQQAQFDWSEYVVKIGDTFQKIYIFLVILSYSRKKYFIASRDVKQPSVLAAIEAAWRYFGGAPKTLLVDNAQQMRTIIDRKTRQWNRQFLYFLGHYGVSPQAHQVRHPYTKGKVERPFRDLAEDFIKGAQFQDWEELTQKLHAYCEAINEQFHSTIQQIPNQRFEQEKGALQPLPEPLRLFHKDHFRKVSMDCLISFEGNRYSVPYPYAGKHVWVYPLFGHTLHIYSQKGQLIASHWIPQTKGNIIINDAHYQGLRKTTPQSAQRLRHRFLELFPTQEAFLQGIAATKRYHWKAHVQRILQLSELYQTQHIQQAIEVATEHNIFTYDYVFHYLKKHHDVHTIAPRQGTRSLLELAATDDIIRSLSEYDQIGG